MHHQAIILTIRLNNQEKNYFTEGLWKKALYLYFFIALWTSSFEAEKRHADCIFHCLIETHDLHICTKKIAENIKKKLANSVLFYYFNKVNFLYRLHLRWLF